MNKQTVLDFNQIQQMLHTPIWRKRMAWCGLAIASIFLLLVLQKSSQGLWAYFQDESGSATNKPQATAEKVERLPNLAKLHLFGTYEASLKQIPKTRSRLDLQGIFSSPDADESSVLIGSPGKPGKFYKKGDELPGGIKVYKILPNSVILERKGKLEKLTLSRKELNFDESPKSLKFDSE